MHFSGGIGQKASVDFESLISRKLSLVKCVCIKSSVMKPFCVFGSVYVSPVHLGLAYYSYFVFNYNFPYSLHLFAHELWKTENKKKTKNKKGVK